MRLDDGATAYAKGNERVTSHFFGQSSFSTLTVTRARNVVKVDTSEVALELLGPLGCGFQTGAGGVMNRSEEHTSELQSLMRISYAVFCLKKKINNKTEITTIYDIKLNTLT